MTILEIEGGFSANGLHVQLLLHVNTQTRKTRVTTGRYSASISILKRVKGTLLPVYSVFFKKIYFHLSKREFCYPTLDIKFKSHQTVILCLTQPGFRWSLTTLSNVPLQRKRIAMKQEWLRLAAFPIRRLMASSLKRRRIFFKYLGVVWVCFESSTEDHLCWSQFIQGPTDWTFHSMGAAVYTGTRVWNAVWSKFLRIILHVSHCVQNAGTWLSSCDKLPIEILTKTHLAPQNSCWRLFPLRRKSWSPLWLI